MSFIEADTARQNSPFPIPSLEALRRLQPTINTFISDATSLVLIHIEVVPQRAKLYILAITTDTSAQVLAVSHHRLLRVHIGVHLYVRVTYGLYRHPV